MVYRLDAMDAYNKKLVKKIAVKTIEKTGITEIEGYLYLQELVIQKAGNRKHELSMTIYQKQELKEKQL